MASEASPPPVLTAPRAASEAATSEDLDLPRAKALERGELEALDLEGEEDRGQPVLSHRGLTDTGEEETERKGQDLARPDQVGFTARAFRGRCRERGQVDEDLGHLAGRDDLDSVADEDPRASIRTVEQAPADDGVVLADEDDRLALLGPRLDGGRTGRSRGEGGTDRARSGGQDDHEDDARANGAEVSEGAGSHHRPGALPEAETRYDRGLGALFRRRPRSIAARGLVCTPLRSDGTVTRRIR